MAVSLVSTGVTFPDGSIQTTRASQVPAFTNRIINGAMVIDQRNAGASVTPTNGQYLVDRWAAGLSQASKFSAQQNSGAVTPPSGYINYLGIVSLSAYAIGASDTFFIRQAIEGLNVADLGWGTASAQTITLSFWVRSSLTGTFGGAVQNSAASRNYPFSYTITSANTWEQKSITISGDTTGTWLTTNGIGLQLIVGLGIGSTLSGTGGAWTASNIISVTGATSVVGTNAATFYITGVQLEVGTVATSFDFRSYGTELALCQRYYYAFAPASLDFQFPICRSSTTASDITIAIPNSMRATPSIVGSPNYARIVGYDTSFGLATASCTAAVVGTSANLSQINVTFTNGSMAGTYVHCSLDTVSNNGFSLSAEL
jgi:hypothetical protein